MYDAMRFEWEAAKKQSKMTEARDFTGVIRRPTSSHAASAQMKARVHA
jgi:hypothetical protein